MNIGCYDCNNHIDDVEVHEGESLEQVAERYGWEFAEGVAFLCPDCK